jgi:hypothetical protein
MPMPKKKVISILEFLRTGSISGISVDSSIADAYLAFGKPDYAWQSFDPDVLTTIVGFSDLEIWFENKSQRVRQIKFKLWEKAKPITVRRAKLDPWVIFCGLQLETAKRFFKSANLDFVQTKSVADIDQIRFQSGVTLLFDPDNSDQAGLGWIGIIAGETHD